MFNTIFYGGLIILVLASIWSGGNVLLNLIASVIFLFVVYLFSNTVTENTKLKNRLNAYLDNIE